MVKISLKKLSAFQQLQLAVFIIEKALPVWERFTALQSASYRSTTKGPVIVIETNLLHKAMEEISSHLRLQFPAGNKTRIHQYYIKFVDPVIAMHDGLWFCSYPVKKVFLAVYFILKSILEQNHLKEKESHLTTAISYSIDSIELSKLYSEEKLISILADYQVEYRQSIFEVTAQ